MGIGREEEWNVKVKSFLWVVFGCLRAAHPLPGSSWLLATMSPGVPHYETLIKATLLHDVVLVSLLLTESMLRKTVPIGNRSKHRSVLISQMQFSKTNLQTVQHVPDNLESTAFWTKIFITKHLGISKMWE